MKKYFLLCLVCALSTPGLTARAGEDTMFYFAGRADARFGWLDAGAYTHDCIDGVDQLYNLEELYLTSVHETLDICMDSLPYFDSMVDSEPFPSPLDYLSWLRERRDVRVRIICNRENRLTRSALRAQKWGCEVADDNLPALVHRVNFQADPGAEPDGWLIDRGRPYGTHSAGVTYGWDRDMTGSLLSAGAHPSSLIDDSLFHFNMEGSRRWQIHVPNGCYYVLCVAGYEYVEASTFLTVQGEPIFPRGHFWADNIITPPGEFGGALVAGGFDEDLDRYRSKRVEVTDELLTLEVGPEGAAPGISSLCYIEIYRADGDPAHPGGDPGENPEEVQERGTRLGPFMILDGLRHRDTDWYDGSVWYCSSDDCSETSDAIIIDEQEINDAFLSQFEILWGSSGPLPDPARSRFGRFKDAVAPREFTVDGHLWRVFFSPTVPGSYDMFSVVGDFLGPAHENVTIMLERFTDEEGVGGFNGPKQLMYTVIRDDLLDRPGLTLYGLVNGDPDDAVFGAYEGRANAGIAYAPFVHSNFALTDALNDTPGSGTGKVLCGSMDWTRDGMHHDDRVSLIIENPSVANQYLQHAMYYVSRMGISPVHPADIVLVMDRTSSMWVSSPLISGTRLETAKTAAHLFLDLIGRDDGHRVSIVEFDETAEAVIDLQALGEATIADLHDAIDAMDIHPLTCGRTAYGLALQEAYDQFIHFGPDPPRRRIVHFFTDGREDYVYDHFTHEPLPMADDVYPALADAGIEIHATGFGSDISADTLSEMAEAGGGSFAEVRVNEPPLYKRFIDVALRTMDWDILLDPSYLIGPNRPASTDVSITVETRMLTFIITWNRHMPHQAVMSVVSPTGVQLNAAMAGVRESQGDGYAILRVDLTKCTEVWAEGTWDINLSTGPEFEGEDLEAELVVIGDTDIDFEAEVRPDERNAHSVHLLCRMINDGTPVGSASSTVRWTKPPYQTGNEPDPVDLVLFDDGMHGDGAAQDGLFGAYLYLQETGCHNFHFISKGQVPGEQFDTVYPRREALVSCVVKEIVADTTGGDMDGDGIPDCDEVTYNGNPDYHPYDPRTGEGTDLNADAADSDGDGFTDYMELTYGTNPLDHDSKVGKIRINFQVGGAEMSAGYLKDGGESYLEGRGFGWR